MYLICGITEITHFTFHGSFLESALSWTEETNLSQIQDSWKKEKREFSSSTPPSHTASQSTSRQGDACGANVGLRHSMGYSFAWAWRLLVFSFYQSVISTWSPVKSGFGEVGPIISSIHGLLLQLMVDRGSPKIFKPLCHNALSSWVGVAKKFVKQDAMSTHAIVLLVWHRKGMCTQPRFF